eukprot:tig00000459_g1060.t1
MLYPSAEGRSNHVRGMGATVGKSRQSQAGVGQAPRHSVVPRTRGWSLAPERARAASVDANTNQLTLQGGAGAAPPQLPDGPAPRPGFGFGKRALGRSESMRRDPAALRFIRGRRSSLRTLHAEVRRSLEACAADEGSSVRGPP